MAKPFAKCKTNVDLLNNLAEFSPYGPMSQVFIMTAIEHYAQNVIDSYDPAAEDDSQFISKALWFKIAADVNGRIKEFYRQPR